MLEIEQIFEVVGNQQVGFVDVVFDPVHLFGFGDAVAPRSEVEFA